MFQLRMADKGAWMGAHDEERQEGTRMKRGEFSVGGEGRNFEKLGKRKFGRVTNKISLGEKLEILEEQAEKENESSTDPEDNAADDMYPLERQDSGLSTISTFSEIDLDEFYVDENPPEDGSEEEESGEILEGFEEEIEIVGEINLIGNEQYEKEVKRIEKKISMVRFYFNLQLTNKVSLG